jgi:hypothetical protein
VRARLLPLLALLLAGACGPPGDGPTDAGTPWATRVVSFTPGPGAGFGQDAFPEVVLGPPHGAGASAGSLDVLSLGKGGVIVLELGQAVLDGPGADLLVFENPFLGFQETGVVAVSEDALTWHDFPCAAALDGGTAGCAGLQPVYANPDTGVASTEPAVAGGDAFDLALLGVARARFVRVTDPGANRSYAPPGGGFDLDAVAVVHGGP